MSSKEALFQQIQAKLTRNYQKQVRYYLCEDCLFRNPLDEHWIKRQFDIVRLIQKNYFECIALIRDDFLPYKFIWSESRRRIERELLGKW